MKVNKFHEHILSVVKAIIYICFGLNEYVLDWNLLPHQFMLIGAVLSFEISKQICLFYQFDHSYCNMYGNISS